MLRRCNFTLINPIYNVYRLNYCNNSLVLDRTRNTILRASPCTYRYCSTSKQTSKDVNLRTISTKKVQTLPAEWNEERLYVAAQNDPDVFGGNNAKSDEKYLQDEDDAKEEKFLDNPPKKSQKLSTKQYADMIKDHLKNNRLKEAIDVLETRMIQEDRVKPENYIYNLLIGECGRHGYSKKAFNLYTKMKQRGLKVTGGTYTALFNACATCPWPADGLNKANRLREIMLEKQYTPNASNYNAMIKAYGRCNDIKTAFQLVDEMKAKELEINVDTFNFLLQAAASDKEFGFRHALIVWHKMLQRKLLPDIYSFNLMLRCVRDCGIGDLETMEQVIGTILLESHELHKPKISKTNPEINAIRADNDATTDNSILSNSEPQEVCDETPNLLSHKPHLGSLVKLSEIERPEHRLLLLGGASAFLKEMEWARAIPTIKTFTALIDVIPSTDSAEKFIIAKIRKLGIKSDIDFFNILIKKRSMRSDYEGGKNVLNMIRTAKLEPDIVTYGVLALGCQSQYDARELLQEMYNKDLRMNIQILGAMLKCGIVHKNFDYILEIMDIVKTEQIKPNEQFLSHLYKFDEFCSKLRRPKYPDVAQQQLKLNGNRYRQELQKWLKFMGLNDINYDGAVKIVREHPWDQFKHTQAEGMEDVKNVKLRHKNKLTRYINPRRPSPEKLEDSIDSRSARNARPTNQIEGK